MSQSFSFKNPMHSHLCVINSHLIMPMCQLFGGMDKFKELMRECLGNTFKNHWDTLFNVEYTEKLGKRLLANFSETLREVDNQVGTSAHKVLHINLLCNLLLEKGFLNMGTFFEKFPNFTKKAVSLYDAIEEEKAVFYATDEKCDFKQLERYTLCFYNGEVRFIEKSWSKTKEFKAWCPVPIGHWATQPRKNVKPKRKCCNSFFLKPVDGIIYVIDKSSVECFSIYQGLNFNIQKFMKDHREKTWQEVKTLVELKHKGKEVEWFNQYLVEEVK